ncbi:uncharacterized protein LOC135495955 [Lineus longissimus]|uniref:uncharacterized protein LOC135495955 n=1 Tax=Lineus longissimus TaxID=88925 RepID=UPI002B4E2BE9
MKRTPATSLISIYLILTCVILIKGEECLFGSNLVRELKVGESGVITSPSYPESYQKIQLVCDVQLKACLNCIIQVTFEDFSLPKCTTPDIESSMTEDYCDMYNLCEYFLINEPTGKEGLKKFEGFQNQTVYTSKTPNVQIRFCYSSYSYGAEERRWKISYSASENAPTFVGADSEGILRSHGFPTGYQGGTTYNYLLRNTVATGFVMIVFDDLDLDFDSKIRVYDSDKASGDFIDIKGLSRGAHISETNTLFLEFYAGTQQMFKVNNLGFKLTYSFVSERPNQPEVYTYKLNGLSDYGYVQKQLGRKILDSPYDYLWRVIPPKGLRAYLKVTDIFTSASSKDWSIRVHEGNSSDGNLLAECKELKNCRNLSSFQPDKGFTSFRGLYLRIKGRFTIADSITFAYAAFNSKSSLNLEDCELEFDNSISKGFYCVTSGRCIPARFKCDNYDHCGDNADEARCENIKPTPTASCGWRFECADRRCVDFEYMCDPCYGTPDCKGEDKKECEEKARDNCKPIIDAKEKEMLTHMKGPNLLWVWITLACVTLISVICVAGFIRFRKKGGSHSAVYQATENGRPLSKGSDGMNGDAQNIRLSQNMHSSYHSLHQNSNHGGSHQSIPKHSSSITQIVPPMTDADEPLIKKKEPDEEPLVVTEEPEELVKKKLDEQEEVPDVTVIEPVDAEPESDPPNYEEVVVVQVLNDKDEAVQPGADDDGVQPNEDDWTKLV